MSADRRFHRCSQSEPHPPQVDGSYALCPVMPASSQANALGAAPMTPRFRAVSRAGTQVHGTTCTCYARDGRSSSMDDDNWRRYHPVLLQLSCKPTGHTHMEAATLSLSGCGTCGYGYLFVSPGQVFPPPFQYSLERAIHYGYRSPFRLWIWHRQGQLHALVPPVAGNGRPDTVRPSVPLLRYSRADDRAPWLPQPRQLVSPRSTPPSQTASSIVQRKTVTPLASTKSPLRDIVIFIAGGGAVQWKRCCQAMT